ncbi:hypothetical protein SDC9_132643 [bioreactor metagenome]|uniref:Uncharacterized protein n=1 Tax=bioreactor metagenome TaxID=1076179 RepID=A0A645DAC4_9ZZZZ
MLVLDQFVVKTMFKVLVIWVPFQMYIQAIKKLLTQKLDQNLKKLGALLYHLK